MNERIQHYFNHPNYIGKITQGHVLSAMVQSETLGKAIRLQIKLNDLTIIEEARCMAHGCPYTIAVANYLCELISGKPLTWLHTIDSDMIKQQLNLPSDKVYCALMGEDVIKTLLRESQS